MTTRRRLLIALPIALLLLFTLLILALPDIVAAQYNRSTIEAFASALTGRTVRIGGKLSLSLLPNPEIIAGDITITGPHQEVITARSLTLDIAAATLLRGQLSAQRIALQSPRIALPWPLPGGAAGIAPPPWLTALHAQIANGTISLGGLSFSDVNADLFTGGSSTVSIAGTGAAAGTPVTISASLARPDAAGNAGFTIDAAAAAGTGHLTGSIDAASEIAGVLKLSTASPAYTATAHLQAVGDNFTFTAIQAQSISPGNAPGSAASLTGTAALDFSRPLLTLSLAAQNLTLPPAASLPIPTHLTLSAANTVFGGLTIPQLDLTAEASAAGITLSALTATLPGASQLTAAGRATPDGNWQGQASLHSGGFPTLFAALAPGLATPETWQTASLATSFAGPLSSLRLTHLTGTIGASALTGSLILTHRSITGALHFTTLPLDPFTAWRPGTTAHPHTDLEITAGRATLHGLALTHLLLDASTGDRLVIRRLCASVGGGLAAGSLSLAANGDITAARFLLTAPEATPFAAPLAALLPAGWRPPASFTAAPLALSLLAAGPVTSLATSFTLGFGAIAITGAPVIDLTHDTATGAFTLRHPSAIAAFKSLGLPAGLAWPGAGSIALRATATVSPGSFGLNDFILSLGALTANGRLLDAGNAITGDIAADTLALPALPASFTLAWPELAGRSGKVSLTANTVQLAGQPLFGAASATIGLNADTISFALNQASLGNGQVSGTATVNLGDAGSGSLNQTVPPSLAATLHLAKINTAGVALPLSFPLTLPSGIITATAKLTATGYIQATWRQTLAGTASLTGSGGTITGFDLPSLTAAFTSPHRATALRTASLTGTTPFTTLELSGSLANGLYTIQTASLASAKGAATATGSIDLADRTVALKLDLIPAIPTPPPISLTLLGSWSNPKKIPATKAALGFRKGQ